MENKNGKTAYEVKKLSIVIPAKDEEENLALVLGDLRRVLEDIKINSEIIVVNDGSKDRTAQVALNRGVNVINNCYRHGKGNALRAGFKRSTGDVIVMLDADYSHRPEDLPLFLDSIKKGAGLVIGSRIWGGSDEYTRVRALGNVIFTAIFGFIFHRYLSDLLNGYKAFRREIFDNYVYKSSDFEIEIELAVNTLRCGYRIAEVPSHERQRAGGEAKSRVIRHGFKFLIKMISEGVKFHNTNRQKSNMNGK